MCKVKAPKPQVIEQERPVFARNAYLDDAENSRTGVMRRGRSSLVIPMETGIGFEGRGGVSGRTELGDPLMNGRGPGGRSGGTGVYGNPGVTTPAGRVPGAAPGPTTGGGAIPIGPRPPLRER